MPLQAHAASMQPTSKHAKAAGSGNTYNTSVCACMCHLSCRWRSDSWNVGTCKELQGLLGELAGTILLVWACHGLLHKGWHEPLALWLLPSCSCQSAFQPSSRFSLAAFQLVQLVADMQVCRQPELAWSVPDRMCASINGPALVSNNGRCIRSRAYSDRTLGCA